MQKIVRIWRKQLPHWEVENGTYFITVRCAGSLPDSVKHRLRKAAKAVVQAEAKSLQLIHLQRQYFLILDTYLDRCLGLSPFVSDKRCKEAVPILLNAIASRDWQSGPLILMPNHIHFVTRSNSCQSHDLQAFMTQFKGRTSRQLNQLLNRTGRLWQEDWFDHWIRSNTSLELIRHYIQQNPIKAGLCQCYRKYPGYSEGSIHTVIR
ncbi:MAG: transposase [Opitutales bacterium]|nr:transposase [Opitutales bacterium]